MGASVFVLPVIQKLASIDLSARQISVSVGSAVSAQGIKCSLEGVAIVKVGGAEDSIRAAAQRFLGQQDAHRALHPGGPRRLAALDRRPPVGRGDHQGPCRLRPRGGRGGRVVADQPGPRARHVPAAGHPDRGQLPEGPRPAGGGARREGGGDRRVDRPPGGRAGPPQGGGGDRHRQPRTAAAQGGDPGRDRRRHGPGRGGRPDRQGGQRPGGHRRPGAGRRATGACCATASSTPRCASRPTPSATPSRRPPRPPRRGRSARPRPTRPAARRPPRRCAPRVRPRRRRSSPGARPRRRRWRRRPTPTASTATPPCWRCSSTMLPQLVREAAAPIGCDRQGHGHLDRGRIGPHQERRQQRHPGHAARQRPARRRPRRDVPAHRQR